MSRGIYDIVLLHRLLALRRSWTTFILSLLLGSVIVVFLKDHTLHIASEDVAASQSIKERTKLQVHQRGKRLMEASSTSLPLGINQRPIEEVTKGSFPVAYQDDPNLVSYVRQSMFPPSANEVPYNLEHPEKRHFSQYNQSRYVVELLKGMRNGFFIELGALDGESHSNTIFLERELGWKGLLIEPLPTNFKNLMLKRRKAYSIHAGAAVTNRSALTRFSTDKEQGLNRIEDTPQSVTIETFPLYTMMLAVNVTLVDFLSLDIEGDELKVLRTIPWDKVQIRVMCIEVNHLDLEGGLPAVVAFMEKQDYILIGLEDIDAWFAKKELLEEALGKKLVKGLLEFHELEY